MGSVLQVTALRNGEVSGFQGLKYTASVPDVSNQGVCFRGRDWMYRIAGNLVEPNFRG